MEESSSAPVVSDREAIADLIHRWAYYRDRGHVDQLRNAFHPDGTICVTWFEGTYEQFVDACSKPVAKGDLSKHLMGTPLIRISGNRAVSEVNATICLRRKIGPVEVDITAYARLVDLLEKRDGTWRISNRTVIYEKDRMDPVRPSLLFWIMGFFTNLKKYPGAYRYLAYILERKGGKVAPNIVEDKSEKAELLYKMADDWLSG